MDRIKVKIVALTAGLMLSLSVFSAGSDGKPPWEREPGSGSKATGKVAINYQNLGPAVNSPFSDKGPIIDPEGKVLYFASDRPGGMGGLDIWMSLRKDTVWQEAVNLGPTVNSSADETPGSYSLWENALYFTLCNGPGAGGCDIFVTFRRDDGWSKPSRLEAPVNTKHDETSASISSDGRFLVFASDRPAGLGGFDLWMSHREDGKPGRPAGWKEPVNLGPNVNSDDWEGASYLLPDDQTLYFSSLGRGGEGRADIFRARYFAGEWHAAENVKDLINTPGDELCFSLPGYADLAYFAREAPGGMGKEDIYELACPVKFNKCNLVVVRGTVLDRATNLPVRASVKLLDQESGQVLAEGKTDPESGRYQLTVDKDQLELVVMSGNYQTYRQKINVAPHQNCAMEFRNVKLQRK